MLASTTKLAGRSLIGFREGAGNMEPHDSTGQRLEPGFISATSDEADLAARLAAEAFEVYRRVSGRDRGASLRTIAAKIEVIAGEIVERAGQENALPAGSLQAETARTCNQLRVFAQFAEDWSWFNARIDRAERDRKPTPRPDIRSMLHPLGPVVVFGASNFPLAFSVAGGDTASALADENTLIVKAHAAHPRTSEPAGRAAQQGRSENPSHFSRTKLSPTRPGGTVSKMHACVSWCGKILAVFVIVLVATLVGSQTSSQTPSQTSQTASPQPRHIRGQDEPTKADLLRGIYGPYRANNDLLFYHLDIRIDPTKKLVSGKNTIRFKMLQDDNRIQLDLDDALNIDKILLDTTPLHYERDSGAVFVDFPATLQSGQVYTIDFYYSGTPVQTGRFGGFTFGTDPSGHPWIYTACEGIGASIWWPNKDQWRDEVENMQISVAIPNDLVDVSNGRFIGKTDLGDGYTRWDWFVHYPINNYDVSVNIGNYRHFSDRMGDLDMDFYALPEDLEKAKKQFTQAKGMIEAFEHYFGEYPFKKDGYKLVEVPYSGMEHQSAVTYGNHFANGYLERDWTGVGISPRFDFIIIHESGHEWFGNSITAADPSDMWIHEGWTTYLESLYVEYMYGKNDAIKYLNGYKPKIPNQRSIITVRGVNGEPPIDQYFKGALFINTLRSIVDDDARWWKLLHDFYQHFKYQNIMTEDVELFFNQQTGMNLTPIFDQYLRHTEIPTLELKFNSAEGTVSFRWKADEPMFQMPVRVGKKDNWQILHATSEWRTMRTGLTKDDFDVANDLYYVNVTKQ